VASLTPGAVIGVGTDLCEVARLRASLDRTPTLRDRLFTGAELDHAGLHPDPVPHLAARFAAKEAVMKALGVGIDTVPFTDVEVRRAPSGAPSVELLGAARDRAAVLGVGSWHLSMTHTDDLAHAVVIATA
jgi:holo-[acyl-carrier protein] synthase